MASTYSPNLRLELMATNEKLNTWGPIANTVFTLVEDAVSGVSNIVFTDATYTMATANGVDDESRAMFLLCTGTNTAVRTLNLPAYEKTYIIRNATTGGFAITVTRGASTYSLANNDTILIYCNGTVVYAVGYSRTETQALFSTQNVTTPKLLISAAGTQTVPTLSWSADPDTGFFNDAGVIGVTTNGVELMRFSTDNIMIGNDTVISPSVDAKVGLHIDKEGGLVVSATNNPCGFFKRNNNGALLQFYRATSIVGSITVDSTSTSYNISSDYRLKKDVETLSSVGSTIDKLHPVSFRWKETNEKAVGFIAHELQKVVPQAVTGEKDGEEMQGVDQSKLIALLVAEIQSLRQRVFNLERQANIPTR